MPSTIDLAIAEPALKQEKARRDLLTFSERMDPFWERSPHLELLATHLQRLERREIRRLFVAMPPRHGKTELASRKFVAWYLGRNPRHQVILASYASELSEGNSRAVRTMMEDDTYPFATRVRDDSRSVGRFETTQGGVLVAVGVGSGLTGRGGSLIIADDLIKGPQEADSEATRASTAAWWQEVLMTRQMPGAAMLLIGTRWREDDIMGLALEAGGDSWTKLVLPFEAEENDALGRDPGQLLWPARFTRDDVPSIEKGDISSRAWSALYQGRPVPADGHLFKREWFTRRFTHLPRYPEIGDDRALRLLGRPRPMERGATIVTLDAASKTGVANDYSVFCVLFTDGVDTYILDVVRKKVEFADLYRLTARMYAKYQPEAVYVEDASAGIAVIQELRRASRIPVIPLKNTSSKLARAAAITGICEAEKIVLPEGAPWINEFLDELCSFPAGRHDDQVDAFTMGVDIVRKVLWERRSVSQLKQQFDNRMAL